MSSSGIIYAIIVGAWAVYLVPMWLRREDELNRARETQRYAAAIKVLANKEAFERRWAHSNEADDALPLAAGQGTAPIPRTAPRVSGKATPVSASSAPATSKPNPTKRPTVAASATAATTAARNAVTANIGAADNRSTRTTPTRTASAAAASGAPAPAASARRPSKAREAGVSGTSRGAQAPRTGTQPRTGLMARRRRVVALLFTISTFGALVSADLGARYLWVMAIPAVLLSAYIARLRREERIRAAARVAKRAAAQQARAADLARAEAEATRVEAAEAQAVRADARAEAELRRHTETARRRASAAARARAQAFTQEAPDFRKASNG